MLISIGISFSRNTVKMFNLNKKISSDITGYDHLIDLYHRIRRSPKQKIIINFANTSWFEANLSAVMGAIVELVKREGKTVEFRNISNKIQDILQRNKFLGRFGFQSLIDHNNTVVDYQTFSPEEDDAFMAYIKNELLSKRDFPRHSFRLGKKINESIFELYENARTHGLCKQIHTCGQYYPGKTPKRLDITIVDMGQTIKHNVNNYLDDELEGYETIEWALKYGNTTKTGNISGGLGLDIIFEFIKLNKGKIQIVSSDGYWEYRRGKISTDQMNGVFPGTIANIEFNLDDSSIYKLKEEISLDDIF